MKNKNIVAHLKNAHVVRFTDDKFFNKDRTGVKNLIDIKDLFYIKGNLKLVGISSNTFVYRLSDSYNFTLTIIY